jgi:hypothetical protein
MKPESLDLIPDDFLELLDNGLEEVVLIQFIKNHSPYAHFGKCTLCDGLGDLFDADELDFGFVASVIANHPSATALTQEEALNSALGQSEADATAEVAFALVQNPSCTVESLQNCIDVNNSLEMFKLVFNHPNVSEETKDVILDEVDNDISKLK